MNFKSVKFFAGAFAVTASLVMAQQTKDWVAVTRQDIRAIHDAYHSSHPGMLNKDDPDFAPNLERYTKENLALADRVNSQAGHHAVLSKYMTAFGDGHSYWYEADERLRPKPSTVVLKSPGFVLGARNSTVMVVATIDTSAPPVGAVLQSCDGVTTKELLETRINPYFNDTTKPRNLMRYARYLLIDSGIPFLTPLKSCSFKQGQSVAKSHALRWRVQSDTEKVLFDNSVGESLPEAAINIAKDGIAWVAFPTFGGDLSKSIEGFKTQIDLIRKAKAIVLDLRGNTGGSSYWGYQLASALWGERFVDYKTWNGAYPEWRTSQANVDFLKFLSAPETGYFNAEQSEQIKPLIAALESRVPDADKKLWAEPSDSTTRPKAVETQFPKLPVYVLQDTACGSACLDFMNVLKQMPNVKFLGQVTGYDTNYLEVRLEKLPSGEGLFSTPMKVWRNRLRASGQAYEPDLVYPGIDWSEAAVRQWALTQIK
jgi:hypothetical protein